MEYVSINKERIKYLLSLYKMTVDELLCVATKGLKNPFTWQDVYQDQIPLNVLKRIDRVFRKGLFYYADPVTPVKTKSASVFFRKTTFGADLNLGARQRVREFEDLKNRLNTLSKLSDIALERRQESFSREIFTLAHELGHYLLDREEVEEVDLAVLPRPEAPISAVETWCNTFAYYLLLGAEKAAELDALPAFEAQNNYGHESIARISRETNLSRLAIYTHLLFQKRLSYTAYQDIRDEMEAEWQQRQLQKAQQREQDKEMGIEVKGRNPQPIRADIVKGIFSVALSSGVIGEREYCQAMRIKPTEINEFRYQ